MNTLKKNNKLILYESKWRQMKDKKTYDSEGVLFPYPTERIKTKNYKWKGGQKLFVNKLNDVQKFVSCKKKKNTHDCLICGKKNISKIEYNISNITWDSGLSHYITEHAVKPTQHFIDMIFRSENPKSTIKRETRIINNDSTAYVINGLTYVKLDKNHINIFDALMDHGGGNKKYKDKNNPKYVRNSEHFGLIDYNEYGLDKILISGKTDRIDKEDNEIFLPKNIPESYDYEYIFHTHPPTPTPGGRAEYGILYEFPSISDIFYFIDHFNNGNTQGSIIMAPEGLYCIRKLVFNLDKISVNENDLFENIKMTFYDVQEKAIRKYGTNFDNNVFYKKISQDKKYINTVNKCLNNYGLHIDYYSRTHDSLNDLWFVDSIYLPIFITEPIKKK